MIRKREDSYSLFCDYLLTIQEFNREDPIPRLKKIDKQSEVSKFLSGFYGKIIAEKKIDGVSCYLTYKDGVLIRATTKKDLNITRIIKSSKLIPKKIDKSFTGGIRGELFISKKKFIQINEEQKSKNLKEYKSPLTALVGIIGSNEKRTQDKLDFQGYLINSQDPLRTQLTVLRKLRSLGINKRTKNFYKTFTIPNDIQKIQKYISNRKKREDEYLANIDGLVIKANMLTTQRLEKKSIAFKYHSIQKPKYSKIINLT
jgi:DNA ligase (NAD+)